VQPLHQGAITTGLAPIRATRSAQQRHGRANVWPARCRGAAHPIALRGLTPRTTPAPFGDHQLGPPRSRGGAGGVSTPPIVISALSGERSDPPPPGLQGGGSSKTHRESMHGTPTPGSRCRSLNRFRPPSAVRPRLRQGRILRRLPADIPPGTHPIQEFQRRMADPAAGNDQAARVLAMPEPRRCFSFSIGQDRAGRAGASTPDQRPAAAQHRQHVHGHYGDAWVRDCVLLHIQCVWGWRLAQPPPQRSQQRSCLSWKQRVDA